MGGEKHRPVCLEPFLDRERFTVMTVSGILEDIERRGVDDAIQNEDERSE